MQKLDLSEINTTSRLYEVSPFRKILNTISDTQSVSLLGVFFTRNRKAVKFEDLCNHNIKSEILKIKSSAVKYEKIEAQLAKDIHVAFLRRNRTLWNKLIKQRQRQSDYLYFALNNLKEQYIELFNNIHTIMKIIYAFENDIEVSAISDIKLTLIDLMNNTYALSTTEKQHLYELNSLRNLLSHQEITVRLSAADWRVLLDNITCIDLITTKLIEDNLDELQRVKTEAKKLAEAFVIAQEKQYKEELATTV